MERQLLSLVEHLKICQLEYNKQVEKTGKSHETGVTLPYCLKICQIYQTDPQLVLKMVPHKLFCWGCEMLYYCSLFGQDMENVFIIEQIRETMPHKW